MAKDLMGFIKQMNEYEVCLINSIISSELSFIDVPEFLVSQTVSINAVAMKVDNLKHVPLSKLDNMVCLAACQIQPNLFMSIPEERCSWVGNHLKTPFLSLLSEKQKSRYLCRLFIKIDHNNILFVPDEMRLDRAFLELACQLNPHILSVIDESLINNDLCNLAIDSKEFSLSCLPAKWRTKQNCKKAFDKNYQEIINFPKELVTYDYVLKAMGMCSTDEVLNILKLIHIDDWDQELIVEAIKKNEYALRVIPFEKINADLIYVIAPYLTRHEILSQHVPESVFSQNLCHRLVSCNPMLLGGIPAPMRDRALCFDAVSSDGRALQFAPHFAQNDALYKAAVTNNGLALEHVPTPYRDEEIPYLAIRENGEAIQFIPDYIATEVLCRDAVMQNANAIFLTPKRFQSTELFSYALRSIPQVLKLIPADLRSVEQCISAIERDPELFGWVPVHVRENNRFMVAAIRLGLMQAEEVEG